MLNIPRLDNREAHQLIDGARAKAEEIGVAMCIAVVDESGNLIAFDRMNGAKITSIDVARNKAFTAAAARKPTHDYNKACVPGELTFGIHTQHGGRLCVVGGGLPVVLYGDVVGGIGLSSGTPEQDIECAQAGIDHLKYLVAESE